MLRATVERSTPITFGALAGLLGERVAVINIAIEGQLLAGAFVGVIVGSLTGNAWPGVAAAIGVGLLFGWVLAVLAIRYRVDQIIIGVVINIFVLGLTSFLTQRVLSANPHLNQVPTFRAWQHPRPGRHPHHRADLLRPVHLRVRLADPGGRAGLRASSTPGGACGRGRWASTRERRTRWASTSSATATSTCCWAALVAGFGGAYFTLGTVGRFDENMTNGRGFIALAAMIFGRWHPVGALSAALIFGFADALAAKLGILQTGIPSEFLLMAPYLATLVVVTGIIGKARAPAADGQVYDKE